MIRQAYISSEDQQPQAVTLVSLSHISLGMESTIRLTTEMRSLMLWWAKPFATIAARAGICCFHSGVLPKIGREWMRRHFLIYMPQMMYCTVFCSWLAIAFPQLSAPMLSLAGRDYIHDSVHRYHDSEIKPRRRSWYFNQICRVWPFGEHSQLSGPRQLPNPPQAHSLHAVSERGGVEDGEVNCARWVRDGIQISSDGPFQEVHKRARRGIWHWAVQVMLD